MRKKHQNEFGAMYLILALLLGFFLGSIVVYWNFNRQHERLFSQTYEKLLAVFSDNNNPGLIVKTDSPASYTAPAPQRQDSLTPINEEAPARPHLKQKDAPPEDTIPRPMAGPLTEHHTHEVAEQEEAEKETVPETTSIIPGPGITLARDRLLHTHSAIVPLSHRSTSISGQRLDSLLGNRRQPQQYHYFYLEFWESPLNSLGYKMGKNKIVFYGIRQFDMVRISHHKENFYLSNLNELYLLEFTNTFKPLNPLGEPLPEEGMNHEL